MQLSFTGNMDMDRVSAVFREALTSFMSRRKSPLTTQMFTDLFNRFPVSNGDTRHPEKKRRGLVQDILDMLLQRDSSNSY